MKSNRSMLSAELIPVITYPDVSAAADWLCAVLGFSVRLRIGDHRVQLERGSASMVVKKAEAVAGEDASRCCSCHRRGNEGSARE